MKTLALLPLALLSTAALAQDYPSPPPPYDQAHGQPPAADPRDGGYADERYPDERDARDRDYAARSPVDPRTAMAMAGAMKAVTDAILDVRIDGVRRAADPYARNDGAQTIGDLMARRDPNYREHIHQDMARAGRTAIGAARGAGEVKAAADDFARRIERVLNESGY
jgi:hypothetical protein